MRTFASPFAWEASFFASSRAEAISSLIPRGVVKAPTRIGDEIEKRAADALDGVLGVKEADRPSVLFKQARLAGSQDSRETLDAISGTGKPLRQTK